MIGQVFRAGDPEATGSARASQAMEPVTGNYLQNVVSGKVAAQGLEQLSGGYRFDPNLHLSRMLWPWPKLGLPRRNGTSGALSYVGQLL